MIYMKLTFIPCTCDSPVIGNIKPGAKHNFRKESSNSLGTPYDAVSIMHYREYTFSVNGSKTLESKHGIPLGGLELSPTDVKQSRLLYKCPAGDLNTLYCCLYVCKWNSPCIA